MEFNLLHVSNLTVGSSLQWASGSAELEREWSCAGSSAVQGCCSLGWGFDASWDPRAALPCGLDLEPGEKMC